MDNDNHDNRSSKQPEQHGRHNNTRSFDRVVTERFIHACLQFELHVDIDVNATCAHLPDHQLLGLLYYAPHLLFSSHQLTVDVIEQLKRLAARFRDLFDPASDLQPLPLPQLGHHTEQQQAASPSSIKRPAPDDSTPTADGEWCFDQLDASMISIPRERERERECSCDSLNSNVNQYLDRLATNVRNFRV
jgi:hypothetical protein